MFSPGQKVVCINNGPSRFGRKSTPKRLRKGAIYTVTHSFNHPINRVPAVLLVEVQPGFGYSAFDAERFAPVRDRPTSIEVFKRMLTPSKEKA